MISWRCLTVAICAAILTGCSDSPSPTSPDEPSIDRLEMFVRDTREFPGEEVEVVLARDATGSTLSVFRTERDWRPRLLLDSIGPGAEEPDEIREMLASFDVWELAAPNAPGAACAMVNGQWTCHPASNDYTLVMGVGSGNTYRAQRYTHLELSPPTRPVRALGDFVLELSRRLESQGATARLTHNTGQP